MITYSAGKGAEPLSFFVYLIPALGKNKKSCSKRS
ncbi:hypothetical protein N399_19900 [Bacillus licheniformis CG-B52]|nr:hypothetical protein N399_19900 [Bacillus licheniformis CG-B52]KUL12093.1 hypothetical protein LI17339_07175 [Bacillus licheniformis LMG 17339]